jgi:hypothetical protein
VWSDNPDATDLLGFADVTAPIVEAVLSSKLDPVTVGIEGDWGSGKTTMLKVLGDELEGGRVVVIETHPWEYDPETDPKAALIAEVLGAVHAAVTERKTMTEAAKKKFKELAARVQVSKAVKLAATSAMAVAGLPNLVALLDPLFKADSETVPDNALQGFRQEFKELLELDALKDIDRVVVLVDDLDRCLPETVIATLEALKLFLSVPKMAFVIAADSRAVAQAVATKYEGVPQAATLGAQYLEKIIHIPLRVPALGLPDTEAYLALLMLDRHVSGDERKPFIDHCNNRREAGEIDLLRDLPQQGLDEAAKEDIQLARRLAPVLHGDLQGNPRRLKRFLNAYWMRSTVATKRGITLQPQALAKLMVLEQLNPEGFEVASRWAFEGTLNANLKELDENGTVTDGGPKAQKQLLEWAELDPKLAATENLDSYLRLAASLGPGGRDLQTTLSSEVLAVLEALNGSDGQRREMVNALKDMPAPVRQEAADALAARVVTNPDEQGALATAIGDLAQDPELVADIVTALREGLPPAQIEGAFIIGLLPDAGRQEPVSQLVAEWVGSGNLKTAVQKLAEKKLKDA